MIFTADRTSTYTITIELTGEEYAKLLTSASTALALFEGSEADYHTHTEAMLALRQGLSNYWSGK
jgi:hypothetical protein